MDHALLSIAWRSEDDHSQLYLGDSLALMASLPESSVDCIWTDPPYLLSNDGVTCVGGRRTRVNKGDWDRSHGVEQDFAFHLEWLTACRRLLKPAGSIWVSGTLHVYLSVGMALQQLGFRLLNDIIWEKPAPPPNLGCRCFTHSTEVILWATKAP
ncbi:MAG: site-specific DNA-methyltransferase, partial [Chloroflexi bacterium]|nr:site-specific DNA-methyltransferase [Chloroflexota bacterium]